MGWLDTHLAKAHRTNIIKLQAMLVYHLGQERVSLLKEKIYMTGSNSKPSSTNSLIQDFKREAKKLHKQTNTTNKLRALPVIRRLINHNVFMDISVMELLNLRAEIKLKHIYHLLAREVGYQTWGELKQQMSVGFDEKKQHYSLKLKGAGYPNLWFSNFTEAENYVRLNGGEAINVGEQAVVVPN